MKNLSPLFALVLLLLPAGARADDSYVFAGSIPLELISGDSTVTIADVTPTVFVIEGCGLNNTKCYCGYDANAKKLSMNGTGTTGNSTGLDFTCNWKVVASDGSVCTIQWRSSIPKSANNSSGWVLTSGCAVKEGESTLMPCKGHNFTGPAAITTKVQMTVGTTRNRTGFSPSNIETSGKCQQ